MTEFVEIGKLVRDKIPDIIRERNGKCETRELTDSEIRGALLDKIIEEADELKKALGTTEENYELADLLIAFFAFIKETGKTQPEIEHFIDDNLTEKGGFHNRIFLIRATKK